MWRSLVSAPVLGTGGRRFESYHLDFRSTRLNICARMAELADARDLKSLSRKGVRVRPPFRAVTKMEEK